MLKIFTATSALGDGVTGVGSTLPESKVGGNHYCPSWRGLLLLLGVNEHKDLQWKHGAKVLCKTADSLCFLIFFYCSFFVCFSVDASSANIIKLKPTHPFYGLRFLFSTAHVKEKLIKQVLWPVKLLKSLSEDFQCMFPTGWTLTVVFHDLSGTKSYWGFL